MSDDKDWIETLRLTPEMLGGMVAVNAAKVPAEDASRKPRRRVEGAFVIAEIEPLKAAAAALSGSGCRAMGPVANSGEGRRMGWSDPSFTLC